MAHLEDHSLRSQDLVFTLYGDYLLNREAPVRVGSLITLLGHLGMSPMAVRTALSRMTHKGWLAVDRRGTRSFYGLTRRGRRLLEEGRQRIYHPLRDEAWDGSWYLVAYSIPERRRHLRDSLRVKLLWLGCGAVTNGLWISPHDVRAEVEGIAQTLRIERHVEIFRAEHLGFSSVAQLVDQCWDLPRINRRYEAFITRWKASRERCRECGIPHARGRALPPCTTPADCFVRRFLLVHEYRGFALEDPHLPRQLLPNGWKGDEAARVFAEYHALLTEPAERYVDSACTAGDQMETAEPSAAAAGM
ncbi:MAG TPA: PaaX family transcriptional regulator C-terminal domain-containing protein [Gemmatimonadaceae bacterium]|nr:PaaX family transcriptional regulator C-terminal domain-containing protein [Gemmatimonadaceae bacterium]